MNSIKAITQLEELRRDRLSFIQNSDSECEKKYINDVYKNQQLTMDVILQKKGEVTNGQQ